MSTYDLSKTLLASLMSVNTLVNNKVSIQKSIQGIAAIAKVEHSIIAKMLIAISQGTKILENPTTQLFQTWMDENALTFKNIEDSTTSTIFSESKEPLDEKELTLEFTSKESESANLQLDIETLNLASASKGRIDIYFYSYVINQLLKRKAFTQQVKYEELLASSPKLIKYQKFSIQLFKVIPNIKLQTFTKEKYDAIINTFVNGSIEEIRKSLGNLQTYLFYNHLSQDQGSLKLLEKVFIQMLGHRESFVRECSVKYLNTLFDGVDWEQKESFNPIITRRNEPFDISVAIEKSTDSAFVLLILNAPNTDANVPENVITHHLATVKSENDNSLYITLSLNKFWRCGFYDWKLVFIYDNGTIEYCKNKEESNGVFAQGRFIVHPQNIMEQQLHEIMADYTEDPSQTKNFKTLEKEIQEYNKKGVNTLYVLGCFERDNGFDKSSHPKVKRKDANPLGVTNRSQLCQMLGGGSKFKKAIDTAHKLNMNIVVDALARVCSSRMDRKYRNMLLHYLDENGRICLHYGTEGRSTKYEGTALMNYRKKEAWDLLIEEIIEVAKKYHTNGIYLDNGQAWPHILDLNEEEMYRQDSDGIHAYTNEEIMDGIIIMLSEYNGYWGSAALDTYANPMYIKIAKTLWWHLDDFIIISECFGGDGYENRQSLISRSGIIPRIYSLPPAISAILGKQLRKDGTIKNCACSDVSSLAQAYEESHKFMPLNAIVIQSSTSHSWPYPALLYQKAAWIAMDLLFFSSDLPMTFMEECEGKAYRKYTTNVFMSKITSFKPASLNKAASQLRIAMEKKEIIDPIPQNVALVIPEEKENKKTVIRTSSMSTLKNSYEIKAKQMEIEQETGPSFGFDLSKINLHYFHRRNLRKEKKSLKYGTFVQLTAKHSQGVHDKIYAFARVCDTEIAIIACNLADYKVNFWIDTSPLGGSLANSTFVEVQNWVPEGQSDFYFTQEAFAENKKYELNAYQSLCIGVIPVNANDVSSIGKTLSKIVIDSK